MDYEANTGASELSRAKQRATETLVEFDDVALRETLIQAAGEKISQVAKSSAETIGKQIQAIRQSATGFDRILVLLKQL
jgi:hypothetical protein